MTESFLQGFRELDTGIDYTSASSAQSISGTVSLNPSHDAVSFIEDCLHDIDHRIYTSQNRFIEKIEALNSTIDKALLKSDDDADNSFLEETKEKRQFFVKREGIKHANEQIKVLFTLISGIFEGIEDWAFISENSNVFESHQKKSRMESPINEVPLMASFPTFDNYSNPNINSALGSAFQSGGKSNEPHLSTLSIGSLVHYAKDGKDCVLAVIEDIIAIDVMSNGKVLYEYTIKLKETGEIRQTLAENLKL
jgi:hypothetical protein